MKFWRLKIFKFLTFRDSKSSKILGVWIGPWLQPCQYMIFESTLNLKSLWIFSSFFVLKLLIDVSLHKVAGHPAPLFFFPQVSRWRSLRNCEHFEWRSPGWSRGDLSVGSFSIISLKWDIEQLTQALKLLLSGSDVNFWRSSRSPIRNGEYGEWLKQSMSAHCVLNWYSLLELPSVLASERTKIWSPAFAGWIDFAFFFFAAKSHFLEINLGKSPGRCSEWPAEPQRGRSCFMGQNPWQIWVSRFFLIQDSDLSTYICTSYIYIYVYIYIYTCYKILDMRYIIFDISYMIYYWSLWCLEDTRTCTMCFARVNLTVGAEWHISSPKFDP